MKFKAEDFIHGEGPRLISRDSAQRIADIANAKIEEAYECPAGGEHAPVNDQWRNVECRRCGKPLVARWEVSNDLRQSEEIGGRDE